MGCNLGLIFLGCCLVVCAFIYVIPAAMVSLATVLVTAIAAVMFWVIISVHSGNTGHSFHSGHYYVVRARSVKIKVFWAWYDLWIGAFWDRKAKTPYICPVPTVVIALSVGPSANNDMLI